MSRNAAAKHHLIFGLHTGLIKRGAREGLLQVSRFAAVVRKTTDDPLMVPLSLVTVIPPAWFFGGVF
jgi:hypothetical protein